MEPKKIKIVCPSSRRVAQKPGGVINSKPLKAYNCASCVVLGKILCDKQ